MSFDQERTQILIGAAGLTRLAAQRVMVVGLGGVGGFAAEAVARAGIGRMVLVDHDRVAPSNCNRQLLALQSTLGRPKAEVMAERLRDIHPAIELEVRNEFLNPDNIPALLDAGPYDWVIDCIDSIVCKAALVAGCQARGIPVSSALGAGGRVDVTRARITTLARTDVCPLAREMRTRLRRLGASLDYPVVFSDEQPVKGLPHQPVEGGGQPRAVNGTISYMPGLFGLMLAGHAIRQLMGD